jgi:hypothetical protein
MTKNQIHEWHERLEDGRKQYIRAYWDSREWLFRVAHPDGETWMPLENPAPERWLELRDLLFRKYQRKKLPWKYVEQLDKKLEGMGLKPDGTKTSDE